MKPDKSKREKSFGTHGKTRRDRHQYALMLDEIFDDVSDYIVSYDLGTKPPKYTVWKAR